VCAGVHTETLGSSYELPSSGPEWAAADLIPSLIQNVAASDTRCFSSWHTTCVDVLTRVGATRITVYSSLVVDPHVRRRVACGYMCVVRALSLSFIHFSTPIQSSKAGCIAFISRGESPPKHHHATGRERGKVVKVYSAKGRRRHRAKVKPKGAVPPKAKPTHIPSTQYTNRETTPQSGGRAANKRQGSLREAY